MILSRAALFMTGSVPGQRQDDRVGERVLGLAVARRHPREHLRAGLELHVHLQADDGFVVHRFGWRVCQSVRGLVGAGDREELGLLEGLADDLEADRQPALREAAGDADAGQAGQVDPDRVDVVQVHRQRVGGLLALRNAGVGEVGVTIASTSL